MLFPCSRPNIRSGMPCLAPALLLIVSIWIPLTSPLAGDWALSPRLTLSEIYTDNLTLAASNPEDETITRVQPGMAIHGQGRRLQLDLDYALEGLFYRRDSSHNTSHNQLSAKASLDAVKEKLTLDASGSIRQQIIDADQPVSIDNINVGNRTDVGTYSLGAALNQKLGAFATTDLRYRYGQVRYDAVAAANTGVESLSLRIANGQRFSRLNWNAGYQRSEAVRDASADAKRESSWAGMGYQLTDAFSVLIRGGRENNAIVTSRTMVNGSYWGAGVAWTPSPHFSLDASVGERDKDLNIRWTPIERTSLSLRYLDREVGLQTNAFWSGKFEHRTRRSTWELGLDESSTDMQILVFEGYDVQVFRDNQGNQWLVPEAVYSLATEEFIATRRYGALSYRTGKSLVGLRAYVEDREYELSAATEEVTGADANWDWRFGGRTRLSLKGATQHRRDRAANREDDLWHANAGLVRTMGRDLSTEIEYRYTERNSSVVGADYRENRVKASVTMHF